MHINSYYFLLILILFIYPISYFFYFLIVPKKKRKNIKEVLFFDKNKLNFNKTSQNIESLVFIPHPFTNWTLNPNYKNKKNFKVHTLEGFRKTSDDDSILSFINKNKKSYKVICIGGSSTQCQEMDDYSDTWPSKLNQKLIKHNSIVLNFGIGAWTTLHSLIRCVTWLPSIKPNLVIFYQAKNDFTPFLQGSLLEDNISNDYQNIISQYSDNFKDYGILKYFPFFNILFYFIIYKKKLNQFGMLNIYKPKPEFALDGLKRVNSDNIENILFRIKTIFLTCKNLNCKVLYVPEIVHDVHYSPILKKQIYSQVEKISKEFDNVNFFDIESLIKYNKENFIDKMHFTKDGNELFSELLYNKICKDYLEKTL